MILKRGNHLSVSKMKKILKSLILMGLIATHFFLISSCNTFDESDKDEFEINLIIQPDSLIFLEGELITIIASISEENSVNNVTFMINDSSMFVDNEIPFEYVWNTTDNLGNTVIYVIASNLENEEINSEELSIEIIENPLADMIYIPSGTFIMGRDDGDLDEGPAHALTLTNNFYMDKFELSNSKYCKMLNYALIENEIFIDDNYIKNVNGTTKNLLNLSGNSCGIEYDSINTCFILKENKGNRPTTEVTWYGSAFYCNMLSKEQNLTELYNLDDWSCTNYEYEGYRLPTEAEWEYVAKFNDNRDYPWGNVYPTSAHANHRYIYGYAVDIGTYSPLGDSQLGVCNMAGNVGEWVNDWYESDYYTNSPSINPTGSISTSGKTFRGGAWCYDVYVGLRCTYRSHYGPDWGSTYFGFRIIKILI